MRRPRTTCGTLLGLTLFLPACVNEPGSSRATETTTRRSAVTAASVPPNVFIPHREDDFARSPGSRSGSPPAPAVSATPPPEAVPASLHPAHFRNKIVDKPPPVTASPPPPVPAAYIAKQNEYLRRWRELEPTVGNLPTEEQDTRRAALKRQMLGE